MLPDRPDSPDLPEERDASPADWVSKVHPLQREATTDDPLELIAQPVAGDPLVMLECLLQEFAWMGYGAERLLALFYHPGYPVLMELRRQLGDDTVGHQVHELAARWGVLQFRETLVGDEEPAFDHAGQRIPKDHELVPLEIHLPNP